jgi:hypothetical protein
VEWAGEAPPAGTTGRIVIDTALLPVRVVQAGEGRLGLAFAADGAAAADAVRRILAGAGLARAA